MPASEVLLALSRLLKVSMEPGSTPDAMRIALVREARGLFGVAAAALIAAEAAPQALARNRRALVVRGDEVQALSVHLKADTLLQSVLLLPLLGPDGTAEDMLALGDGDPERFGPELVEPATAFADAAAAALAHLRVAELNVRQAAQQSALTRAAKSLHEELDLETLLSRICREALTILDADFAIVYRGTPEDGLRIAAAAGAPPEVLGFRLATGAGLSGKVLQTGRPMITNDYQRIARPPDGSPFARVEASLAMPFHWSDELRGVLSVGYARPHRIADEDLTLLEAFAELAAVACRNASAHAGLALAARTDALTGCLNHAALHEGLQREIERAERAPARALSLILFDLDDFKQVNEQHGHQVGDEVLRQVGYALRGATRPYDLAARYGGDEFALVAVEATEAQASEVARRTVKRITAAVAEFGEGGGATAGVAAWQPGVSPTQLIARADRALLYGKQQGARGESHVFSGLPDATDPGRFERRMALLSALPAATAASNWPEARTETAERLHKRTRQLAFASALGARLSAMTEAGAILDAAVDELHRAFGYYCCAVVRLRPDDYVESAAGRGAAFIALGDREWSQPRNAGLIGRCLRERCPVLCGDVHREPDYNPPPETADVQSELVVPLFVAGRLWGVLNVEEVRPDAFDEDDVRLMRTMADQIGSALRSALLYQQLERAYMGTAEALAAALEAKDSYTAHHAHSIVEHAEGVGRRLGMSADELRDLRFGAVFHDIGKIAVPEAILNKSGPLTPDERVEIERHTIVGEQILAPVEFLAGARKLVRHEHERWDGQGYPDGLAREEIPLGSRIILACDALHAMTSDRPYRKAMSTARAHAELRINAGTQFDARVVEALLAELGAAAGAPASVLFP